MAMYKTACVINIQRQYDENNVKGTGCGILVDTSHGIVLAHGSCLAPFLQHSSHLSFLSAEQNLESFTCEVLVEELPVRATPSGGVDTVTAQLETVSTAVVAPQHLGHIKTDGIQHGGHFPHRKFPAAVRAVFQCSTIQRSLSRLMPETSWELVDRKSSKHAIADSSQNKADANQGLEEHIQQLLSCFIVLELQDWVPWDSRLIVRSSSLCQRGDPVEVCSTPFGGLKPEAFMNSYSRGIISNLAGEDNCLIMSDARCILGGEGAPLYTFHDNVHSERCLTGMIIASLCWKNDEWVGFSVSCAVDHVLHSLPAAFSNVRDHVTWIPGCSAVQKANLSSGVTYMSPEVALLKVGQTWGSGVVVDAGRGLVLTCSHVIKDAHRHPVQMKVGGTTQLLETDVIYRQQPLQHQFDLAVLQCPDVQHLAPGVNCSVRVTSPWEGQEVFVIGHALFGLEHNLQPSVSAGVVSKIISVGNIPVMIQTTCAVHPGASGGALVDRDGQLLGIVVCNARDNTSGASFPHINMSIPLATVWPLITRYHHTKDVRYLAALNLKNKLVNTIWSLGQTSSAANSGPVCVSKL